MWFKEGFATYAPYIYYEYTEGRDYMLEMMKHVIRLSMDEYRRDLINNYSVMRDDYDFKTLYSFLTYHKASLIIHTLRWELGDKTFFNIMKNLVSEFAHEDISTDEIIEYIEEQSGKQLKAFFDSWLYETGYPIFNITSEHIDENGEAKQRVLIEQLQAGAAYVLTLPVDPDGGGPLPTRRVLVESKKHTFTIQRNANTDAARFDYKGRIFAKFLEAGYAIN